MISKIARRISRLLVPESQTIYSQFGEDLVIQYLFQQLNISKPSYLEIGANQPRYLNNTYYFYARGSRGVLIEPNPHLFKKLKAKRPGDLILNIGIGFEEVSEADFYIYSGAMSALSTFSAEQAKHWAEVGMKGVGKIPVEEVIRIPLVPVNNILEAHFNGKAPNYMSVDVEGLDLSILQSMDFNKYKPEVICVETWGYDSNQNGYKLNDIIDFMHGNDYETYADTRVNTIFCRKTLFK
jgi:FkbM family methyltransferase